MSETSQKRALKNYRKRLNRRGMARFEVLRLDADRELIRSLARRLAENRPDSAWIRATVRRKLSELKSVRSADARPQAHSIQSDTSQWESQECVVGIPFFGNANTLRWDTRDGGLSRPLVKL